MKIKLNGDEYILEVGDWIVTKTNDEGQVYRIDDTNGTVEYCPSNTKHTNNCYRVTLSSDITRISNPPDNLVKFLDEHEGAMKEYVKDGIEKPRLSLIPQHAVVEVAKVFGYGANKYDAYNFSKGAYKTTYTDAAQRHINRYLLNEDIDPESGLSHLAHGICCLMMLLDNDLIETSIEDRNKMYKSE